MFTACGCTVLALMVLAFHLKWCFQASSLDISAPTGDKKASWRKLMRLITPCAVFSVTSFLSSGLLLGFTVQWHVFGRRSEDVKW